MVDALMAEVLRLVEKYPVAIVFILGALILALGAWRLSHYAQKLGQQKGLKVWREKQTLTYHAAVKKTEKARKALEQRNGGTMVVDVVHDISSTKSVVPGDIYPAITFDHAIDILEQLRDTDPNGPVDIVLHTLGGFSLAAEIVAAALKAHKGTVTAYVPYIAMSGGTMLALACDRVMLGKNALLGPIDTQYSGYPASAYKKLLDAKKNAIGDISDAYYLRAITSIDEDEDARAKARKMLGDKVADFFLDSRLHHGSGIDFADASGVLGNKLENKCPDEVYAFVNTRLAALRSVHREVIDRRIEELIGAEPEENRELHHAGEIAGGPT